MLVLREEPGEGFGVGRVPGLGAFRLGHSQLIEEHHLQLFWRAEVHLVADLGIRRFGGALDLPSELGPQLVQRASIDGDPACAPSEQGARSKEARLLGAARRPRFARPPAPAPTPGRGWRWHEHPRSATGSRQHRCRSSAARRLRCRSGHGAATESKGRRDHRLRWSGRSRYAATAVSKAGTLVGMPAARSPSMGPFAS